MALNDFNKIILSVIVSLFLKSLLHVYLYSYTDFILKVHGLILLLILKLNVTTEAKMLNVSSFISAILINWEDSFSIEAFIIIFVIIIENRVIFEIDKEYYLVFGVAKIIIDVSNLSSLEAIHKIIYYLHITVQIVIIIYSNLSSVKKLVLPSPKTQ